MKTLYVSDLDGTLLNSRAEVSRFTADTINRLIGCGMAFTVATARSVYSAGGLLKFFDLTVPAITMNGVFLTEASSGQQKSICRIPADTAKRVVDAFLKNNRPPIVYSFRNNSIEAEFTVLKNDYEREFVASRKLKYSRFEKVSNYGINGNTVYINAIDDKATMDTVAAELKNIGGIKFSYYFDTYSRDKYLVEVYSESAGKWNSIKKLKEMYGFDRIVAFGDNENDIEMLQNADLAVVVGNAQPIAIEIADVVIDTNDNDGVAKFLLELYKRGEL